MPVHRLSVLVAVAVATSICLACRNLDVVTASYATLEEARAAGAVERGWIPEGLPAGTRELREAHDLDSNRRWGLFSFPVEQADVLRRILREDEYSLAGVSCDVPRRIEWWPILLRGTLNPERIRTTGLRAYRSISGDLIVLVNWSQGRAYYWALERGWTRIENVDERGWKRGWKRGLSQIDADWRRIEPRVETRDRGGSKHGSCR